MKNYFNLQYYSIRHFLLKLLFFFLIIYFVDYGLGKLFEYLYFKQESGLLYRTTYSIEETKADILIFGSSRANHHYHPEVFEQRFKMSYYNVGRDGNYLPYHYAVLKSILKRHTPKIVILDIVNEEFAINQSSYDKLSCLLPYYKRHPEIRPIVQMKGPYEKFKMVSNLYPYNSLLFTIFVGNMEFNKKRKGDVEGYVPLFKSLNCQAYNEVNPVNYQIDPNKIEIYNSFITDCKSYKDLQLIIINSPYFIRYKNEDYSIDLGSKIASKYHVPFYDFANDSVFLNHPEYFVDKLHLNDKGAKVFSNRLIDSLLIRKIINN